MKFEKNIEITKWYFVSILLFSLPIISSNIYYYDDYGRSLLGYTNWYSMDGRPLAELIMRIFMQGKRMYDVFPLPIITGLIILAGSFAVMINKIPGKKLSILMVGLSIFANPYLIEPLSYRFDSLIFLVSISLSFLFIYTPSRKLRYIYGTTCAFMVLSLYQTSINVLISIGMIGIYLEVVKNNDFRLAISKTLLMSSEIISALLMYLFLNKIIIKTVNSSYHPGIVKDHFIGHIFENFNSYYQFISENSPTFILITFILYVIAIYSSLKIFIKIKTETKIQKLSIVIIAIVFPTVSLICVVGILVLFDKPLLFPRSIIGMSGFYVFSTTLWYLSSKNKNYLWMFLIPLFSSFLIINAFVNAYKSQYETYRSIAQEIKSDTKDYPYNTLNYQFNGRLSRNELMDNTSKAYPLISNLVPGEFYNGWWAHMFLTKFGWKQNPNWYKNKDINISEIACNSKLLANRQDYKIFIQSNTITIDFDKNTCIH